MPRLVGYRERTHEPLWNTLLTTVVMSYVDQLDVPWQMRDARHVRWRDLREAAKKIAIAGTFALEPDYVMIFGFSLTAGVLCWAHDVAWGTTREERELCVEVMLHQLADTFSERGA